jgi:hypothetical protein
MIVELGVRLVTVGYIDGGGGGANILHPNSSCITLSEIGV